MTHGSFDFAGLTLAPGNTIVAYGLAHIAAKIIAQELP